VDKAELQCHEGDVVRVIASSKPELVGAFGLIQRLRSDGRWNVLLDRAAQGVTIFSGKNVLTREFSFGDESLEPLGSFESFTRGRTNRPLGGHLRPDDESPPTEQEAPQ
jgi:hypothetical protein